MGDDEYNIEFFENLFNRPSSYIIDFIKPLINPHNSMGLMLVNDEVTVLKKIVNDIPLSITINDGLSEGYFFIDNKGILEVGYESKSKEILKFDRYSIRELNISTLIE